METNNLKPLFSIIIPTYNRAHIILKLIESVKKQLFKDFEVIIVDNHSTDNIKEVLGDLIKNKEIRFIQHDKNYERAKSRNTGLENARGKYATLIDSDDTVYPEFLESAKEFISQNSKAKVFHSLYNIIDENGELYYKIRFPKITNNLSHIVNGNYLSCHGVFLHKDVFKAIKLDTNPILTGYEDYEYWLRVLAHHKLYRIPHYNSAMVQHKGRSISSFTLEASIKQAEYILDKFKKDPFLKKKYKKNLKRLAATFFLYGSVQSNFKKDFKSTRKYLLYAFNEDFTIIFNLRFLRTLQISLFKKNIN